MPDSLDFPVIPPQGAVPAVRAKVATHNDLSALMQALEQVRAVDNIYRLLNKEDRKNLEIYLAPMPLAAGEKLFVAGSQDRGLYLIESGSFSVHFQDANERIHVAVVGPGVMLGESAFLAQVAHRATVQAVTDSHAWNLTMEAFAEMGEQHPATALAVALAAGRILARRALDRRLRAIST